jgi:hypothetical protein
MLWMDLYVDDSHIWQVSAEVTAKIEQQGLFIYLTTSRGNSQKKQKRLTIRVFKYITKKYIILFSVTSVHLNERYR